MKTFANGRSILHKGDNLTHTAAPPDVCKTPSPAGPVPIPYVNVAMDSSLASGTKKVKVEGKMAAHEKANISTSMGDEPGTAGGLLSSKFKGKLTWATSSPTVKLEGKGAVRFMDVAQHNGNSFNTAFISLGSPGLAYADDFEGQCEICGEAPDSHRVLTQESSIDICLEILAELDSMAAAYTPGGKYGKKQLRKFMIGVMICKCGKKHAAMSGSRSTAFIDAATPLVDEVYTDNVGPADLANANPAAVAQYPHRLERLEERFEDLATANADGEEGYNPPGTCAGPKLLASGCAPAEMTEMFFNSPLDGREWRQTYSVLRTEADVVEYGSGTAAWQQQVLQNMEARRVATEYAPLSEADNPEVPGVASCHTCQDLLYLATCDVEDWSC